MPYLPLAADEKRMLFHECNVYLMNQGSSSKHPAICCKQIALYFIEKKNVFYSGKKLKSTCGFATQLPK